MNPFVFQINVKPHNKERLGIPKNKVEKCKLNNNGLENDYNNFRYDKKKIDSKMALLIISYDLIKYYNQNGWPVKPGDLGENLIIKNLNYSTIKPNQKYQVGNTIIQITFKCDPCKKLRILPYIGTSKINQFIKFLIGKRGWYAKVLKTGTINQNDLFNLLDNDFKSIK